MTCLKMIHIDVHRQIVPTSATVIITLCSSNCIVSIRPYRLVPVIYIRISTIVIGVGSGIFGVACPAVGDHVVDDHGQTMPVNGKVAIRRKWICPCHSDWVSPIAKYLRTGSGLMFCSEIRPWRGELRQRTSNHS